MVRRELTTRASISPSPDSSQVLPREESANSDAMRNVGRTQALRNRDMLSIMEETSETSVRSPGHSKVDPAGRDTGT